MSFLDIFNNNAQTQAANAQIAGINAGVAQALPQYAQGQSQLTQNYTQGLQPFLQNYQQAQPGVQQLGNVLGLNGPAGNQAASQALQSTPGYQFSLQQGQNVGKANAAATGMTGSGNEALALQQQAQGTASQNYNNYVSQLQPYLGAANSAAQGIGGLYSGLGNQLNASSTNTGNMLYGANTSIGNANANAALGNLTGSANLFGLLSGGAGGAASLAGGLLGGTGTGFTSLGTGLAGVLSDRRMKEDIKPVGKLHDGQRVYSFRYKGDDTPQIGLMAQEVEKVHPEAVGETPEGIKFVDLGRATSRAAKMQDFLRAA